MRAPKILALLPTLKYSARGRKIYRIGREEIDELKKAIEGKNLFRASSPFMQVQNFEKERAQKTGANYALCVNSETFALICGPVGLGMGPGDEIIVPGHTFMATLRLRFEDANAARKFADSIEAKQAIESGWHVYANVSILAKKEGHHEALNPSKMRLKRNSR